ncbi:MAG: hypothetical protein HZB21_01285 [Deltaproteobacteria bacterium]|nr:hypothetical protein [Deltaproteobacteria bacterium]
MIEKAFHAPSNPIVDRKTASALTLVIFAFLISLAVPAFSGDLTEHFDFKLKKAGPRCEPEMREWIAVPGRDMKAGSFVYRYTQDIKAGCVTWTITAESLGRLRRKEDRDRTYETCWDSSVSEEEGKTSGVLVNNEAIYYPDGSYWADEMNFGFYKDYLVMDAWPVGAHHDRRMFLYRLGENSVELIDVIGEGYFDFMSARKSEFRSSEETGKSGIIEVADIDHDNNPELKLRIYWDYIFTLYLEIKDNRLKIDLNPELYRPLFERERRIRPNKKTSAYYIYGFLSGKLKLEGIKEMIPRDKRHKERYGEIITLLEKAGKWEQAIHDKEKFVLLKYDLKEAACNE